MQFDFAFIYSLHQAILQNLLGTQTVAPVDEVHLRAEIAEVERLFDSGITTTDHGDFLVPIKEAVTGGTGADAFTHKCRLGG